MLQCNCILRKRGVKYMSNQPDNNQENFEDVFSDSNLESNSIQAPPQESVNAVPTEPVEQQNTAQQYTQQQVNNNTYQPAEQNNQYNQYAEPQNIGQQNYMPYNNAAPAEYYPQQDNGYYNYSPQNQQGYYGYNFQGSSGYEMPQEVEKEKPPRYNVALTSMILGISSLVLLLLSCCCGSFFITWLPSLIGIVLAFVSFSGGNKSGFAVSGLVTNALAFVLSAIFIVLIIVSFATGNGQIYYDINPYV